ncbi:MAG: hypothetical protein ACH36H_04825 [Candidatus Nanopelagicales bacterium]
MTAATSATATVDATTPAVREALSAMVAVVLASGGALHPGLRLVERDGDMTVFCSDAPGPARRPLFDVPRELLIPVEEAVWADDSATLRLVAAPPGLTARQREVLDLHVALYNASDKIRWLITGHPRAALADEPDMVAAVRALRPGFEAVGSSTAQTFLSTRTFGLATAGAEPSGPPAPGAAGEAKTGVLMTLIDLLNHHPRGAPYQVDDRAMSTIVARPTSTAECFATYGGRRDVIDLALQYGYLDVYTPFAHCAPVTVEAPGIGTVTVRGYRMRAPSPLDPPRVQRTDDGLVLSHLTFNRRHPERFHVPLRMALQGAAQQGGLSAEAARKVAEQTVEEIAAANVELLDRIVAAGRAASHTRADGGRCPGPAPAPTAQPALGLLADAATTQADIIRTVAAAGQASR